MNEYQHPGWSLTILKVMFCVVAVGLIYVLSYAPYLAFKHSPVSAPISGSYRSPTIFRGAEWAVGYTPLRPALQWWANCFGVGDSTDVQIFFYSRGISDPNVMHFNRDGNAQKRAGLRQRQLISSRRRQ